MVPSPHGFLGHSTEASVLLVYEVFKLTQPLGLTSSSEAPQPQRCKKLVLLLMLNKAVNERQCYRSVSVNAKC